VQLLAGQLLIVRGTHVGAGAATAGIEVETMHDRKILPA
jgi:hypothetical protein